MCQNLKVTGDGTNYPICGGETSLGYFDEAFRHELLWIPLIFCDKHDELIFIVCRMFGGSFPVILPLACLFVELVGCGAVCSTFWEEKRAADSFV